MASLAAATQIQVCHSFQLKSQSRLPPIERSKHRALARRTGAPPSRLRTAAQFGPSPPAPAKETGCDTSDAVIIREIPGSYGPPLLGVALDRLKYFVLQGQDEFFLSLMRRHNSTVIRVNMPPGPPLFPDSRTIMLLDQKSMPVVFDTSKVEKKDVFAGTYMPSTGFTGGFRVLPYLDPSEPKHTLLKEFCFEILKSNGRKFLPEFHTGFAEAASEWDALLDAKGEAQFTNVCQQFTLSFLCRAILGADPRSPGPASLGDEGPLLIQAWIGAQLAPQTSFGAPKLVEALLHTFPLRPFLVSAQYNKIYQFFHTHGQHLLDMAEAKFGIDRVEACHNLLFFVCFNTWGGFLIFMPSLMERIASAGVSFQEELVQDVRSAVGAEGLITMKALEEMKLVQSTVHEVLRMDPPVPYQYGRAKYDMIIESHEAAYRVRKGEMLACYQKIAMRDAEVFQEPHTFKPRRFMGEEGEKLLQNLTWSNGPESAEPTVSNKQCPGKNFVNLVARMFIAEFFLTYDSFELAPRSGQGLTSPVVFKALKRTSV